MHEKELQKKIQTTIRNAKYVTKRACVTDWIEKMWGINIVKKCFIC